MILKSLLLCICVSVFCIYVNNFYNDRNEKLCSHLKSSYKFHMTIPFLMNVFFYFNKI